MKLTKEFKKEFKRSLVKTQKLIYVVFFIVLAMTIYQTGFLHGSMRTFWSLGNNEEFCNMIDTETLQNTTYINGSCYWNTDKPFCVQLGNDNSTIVCQENELTWKDGISGYFYFGKPLEVVE